MEIGNLNIYIELLEKVEFRLAMAEDDSVFELQIQKFLCPILLKLSSSDPLVKKKVAKY
jgi:hypothetical protein